MPTKEELSQEINMILDTDLDFSQMPKDDLRLFHDLAADGSLLEPQIKHLAKEQGKDTVEEQIDDWYPGKIAGKLI